MLIAINFNWHTISCSLCLTLVYLLHINTLRGEPPRPPITTVRMTAAGDQVVVGSQASVVIYSWPALNELDKFATSLENIHDLQFSPNGEQLAIAGGTPGETGAIEIWDWNRRVCTKMRTVADDLVYAVDWLDERTVVIASADSTCAVYEVESVQTQCTLRFQGHSDSVLTLQRYSGDHVLSAGVDRSIRLWNAENGQVIRTLDQHNGKVSQIVLQPQTASSPVRLLSSVGDDHTIRLWNPSNGRMMRFARIPSIPYSVAWNAHGDRLCVGCRDGKVYVLRLSSLEIEKVMDSPLACIHHVLWPASGDNILVAGAGGIFKL